MRSCRRSDAPVRPAPRFAAALLCGVALAAFATFDPAEARAGEGGLRCREVSFAVALTPGEAAVHDVSGVLCARGSVHHKTVQITLHGSTYSHLYWDWPLEPATYSYVRRATAAGYAVLNLDRIGIGRSDHPPAEAVTIPSNAFVVHQIVQALRGGDLVVPAFGRLRAGRVALVTHSLGALIAIQEAATYGDVDGVVLSGLSHTITPALGEALAKLYPASLDPILSGRGLPDGYLTSQPGDRTIFYHLPTADPAVIALDEQTKETVTTGELATALPALGLSGALQTPVLVVVGDFDLAFCLEPSCTGSGSFADEASFYPPEACAETAVIPDAGHDLNLHPQAPAAYDVMLDWFDRRVGADTRAAVPEPCAP